MAAKKPSFLPMLFLILLSFLNVIAAGFLFYFVAQDYTARWHWVKFLDDRTIQRDGLSTDQLIAELTPEDKARLEKWIADMIPSQLSADQKDRLKQWQAEWTKRQASAGLRLDPLKERADLIGNQESDKLAKAYGAEDYRRILHGYVKLRTPELRGEEQRLAEEKNTLLSISRQYDERIARLQERINEFATDDKKLEELLQKEKDIFDKLQVENQERRREIAGLFAEVEENTAARLLAEGTLHDYQRRRDAIRQKAGELIRQNIAMEQEIGRLEQVASPKTSGE